MSEAVAQMYSVKKVFLKISQNSHENTCARVSFLIKLQALFIWTFCQKFSLSVLFSFCLIFYQFQPSVAYKSVVCKKSVYCFKRSFSFVINSVVSWEFLEPLYWFGHPKNEPKKLDSTLPKSFFFYRTHKIIPFV